MSSVADGLSPKQKNEILEVDRVAFSRSLAIRQLGYGMVARDLGSLLTPADREVSVSEDQRVGNVDLWRREQIHDIVGGQMDSYTAWLSEGEVLEGERIMSS